MMRVSTLQIIGASVLVGGCLGPSEAPVPPPTQFGVVSALVAGRPWTSTIRSDSIVGAYQPSVDRLQVIGQRIQAGQWPTLQLFVLGVRGPGRYPIEANAGQWFTTDSRRRLAAFATTGTAGDEVVIDEFDLAGGRMRGSFRFLSRALQGSSTIAVEGSFAGRLWREE